MLECFQVEQDGEADIKLTLSFEQRQKSRAQAVANTGEKVAWFIERGRVLADGNILIANSGERIAIVAAPETVSEVSSNDLFQLMRAAYHLCNRHVPLQILPASLRYQHDHVLDDMVRGLGLVVECVEKPFHPEAGAYHSHNASHSHQHVHTHDHGHSHG